MIANCAPNLGHELVARCEAELPSTCVITQNIDGLHQRAGSARVHELHGNIWQLRCDVCGFREESHDVPLTQLRCPQCGAFKRPNVVWFGDRLFPQVLQAVGEVLAACDLLISIGTSAVVYPAAQMPLIAKRAGAELVEVNPEATALSHIYGHHLRMSASDALARLCDGL